MLKSSCNQQSRVTMSKNMSDCLGDFWEIDNSLLPSHHRSSTVMIVASSFLEAIAVNEQRHPCLPSRI